MEQLILGVNEIIHQRFVWIVEIWGILFLIPLFFYSRRFSGEEHGGRRDSSADMLRGLAIHGMVIIHIDSYFRYFHPQPGWPLFLANLSRYAVPFFIISSAMFLKWKEGYWKSRIVSLLIPYSIASAAAVMMKGGGAGDLFYKLLTGSAMTPYYFVPLVFVFYILYAMVFRHIKDTRVFLAAALLINLLSNTGLISVPSPWSAFLFTDFILFFAVGMWLKDYHYDGSKYYLLAGILVYILLMGYGSAVFAFEMHNHGLAYPVLVFVFLKSIFAGKSFRYLELSGRYSIGIFLIHPFVIHFMHSFDPYVMGGPVGAWVITLGLNTAWPLGIWMVQERFSKALFSGGSGG